MQRGKLGNHTTEVPGTIQTLSCLLKDVLGLLCHRSTERKHEIQFYKVAVLKSLDRYACHSLRTLLTAPIPKSSPGRRAKANQQPYHFYQNYIPGPSGNGSGPANVAFVKSSTLVAVF
jgi:hypothetical protein